MACAPSEDSDQPRHPPSLIRVFTVCMKKAWFFSYPLSAQWRLWSCMFQIRSNVCSEVDPLSNIPVSCVIQIRSNVCLEVDPLSNRPVSCMFQIRSNVCSEVDPLSNIPVSCVIQIRSNVCLEVDPLSNIPVSCVIQIRSNVCSEVDPLSNIPVSWMCVWKLTPSIIYQYLVCFRSDLTCVGSWSPQ